MSERQSPATGEKDLNFSTEDVINRLVASNDRFERSHLGVLLRIKIEGDCIRYARETLKLVSA